MDKKVKLVIAEENAVERQRLEDCFYNESMIELVGTASNGEQVLEMVERFRPDVLLMDIILPKLDGIAVLERLHRIDTQGTCSVIILSALTKEPFVIRAMDAGAKYFMAKPFNPDIIKARVIECGKGMLPRKSYAALSGSRFEPMGTSVLKSRDEKISTIFITIGIPAHIKGYQFLREAIKLVADNPDVINRITKELYPTIARKFDTTPSKVERAIRQAIEVAWTRGKIDNINQIFGFNVYTRNDKPTNGEFIALVADKLSLEKSA